MICTSINHGSNGMNFQSDYIGSEHNCIADFEKYCIKNDILWAHLFDAKDGTMIATWKKPLTSGLTTYPRDGYER